MLAGGLPPQTHLRRDLVVEAQYRELARALARQRQVERGIRRRPDARIRRSLEFEVAEVVQLVLHDRAAERRAVLLHAHRNHAVRDGILGVEAAALEVAAEQPGQLVRAGL